MSLVEIAVELLGFNAPLSVHVLSSSTIADVSVAISEATSGPVRGNPRDLFLVNRDALSLLRPDDEREVLFGYTPASDGMLGNTSAWIFTQHTHALGGPCTDQNELYRYVRGQILHRAQKIADIWQEADERCIAMHVPNLPAASVPGARYKLTISPVWTNR
ncbi:hypothetical protein BV22DRAFT_604743 [Leucogyrophana mollusca]|uniref:Uncharacterized protein n=1 Tax=Leucogyrophana mollusca TaxID=85980 RepID=A0ACB8BCC7_9AGAM|nr:hypothetical protein BV22DRAFT_604743 [Leucogyrophana mollusca]